MPVVLAAAPVADLVKAYEMKVSDEGGGKGCVALIQVRKKSGVKISLKHQKIVKCQEFHLPLAIFVGHHGTLDTMDVGPEVMRWNSI